jgi:hypothetical protein
MAVMAHVRAKRDEVAVLRHALQTSALIRL